MSEQKDQDKFKNKKTLSLKLGSKPVIAPKRNIEAGKTVIVEKKRFKRTITNENQESVTRQKKPTNQEKNIIEENIKTQMDKKSGVVLKPLTKDEQKKILSAESKKDKKDAIEKIRTGHLKNNTEQNQNVN